MRALAATLALCLAGCTARIDGGDLPEWEPRTPFTVDQVYELGALFPEGGDGEE